MQSRPAEPTAPGRRGPGERTASSGTAARPEWHDDIGGRLEALAGGAQSGTSGATAVPDRLQAVEERVRRRDVRTWRCPTTWPGRGPETAPEDAEPEAAPVEVEPEAAPEDVEPNAAPEDGEPEAAPEVGEPEASPEDAEAEAAPEDGEREAASMLGG